jgi:hypothetical protein
MARHGTRWVRRTLKPERAQLLHECINEHHPDYWFTERRRGLEAQNLCRLLKVIRRRSAGAEPAGAEGMCVVLRSYAVGEAENGRRRSFAAKWLRRLLGV